MNNITKKQIVSISCVVLVAVLGSVFVAIGMDWFGTLTKPSEWIPKFVIPIVWSVIYLLVSVYLFVAIKNQWINKEQSVLFVINGVLNIVWCLLFFTLHWIFVGLVAIILNLVFGFLLLTRLTKGELISKLLLVYPIWLSIATCLNLCLWCLN